MTLGLEFLGVFLAGIAFTMVVLVLVGPKFVKWQMTRMMHKALVAQTKVKTTEPELPIVPQGYGGFGKAPEQ